MYPIFHVCLKKMDLNLSVSGWKLSICVDQKLTKIPDLVCSSSHWSPPPALPQGHQGVPSQLRDITSLACSWFSSGAASCLDTPKEPHLRDIQEASETRTTSIGSTLLQLINVTLALDQYCQMKPTYTVCTALGLENMGLAFLTEDQTLIPAF